MGMSGRFMLFLKKGCSKIRTSATSYVQVFLFHPQVPIVSDALIAYYDIIRLLINAGLIPADAYSN
jgi:hypothetical protein